VKKSLLICVCLLGFVETANAVITFSEFPTGTAISNQYAPQGVLFKAGSLTTGLPVISPDGFMPASPVLRPAGGQQPYSLFQGDFWMEFVAPVLDVTFDSGYWDAVGAAVIDVYDPSMTPLASFSNTTTGVETISISGLGQIGYVYFNSVADPYGGDIDNLAFTSTIPAPGAVLLGTLGTGLLGWLRRRGTL
jgi:hypothetical protein